MSVRALPSIRQRLSRAFGGAIASVESPHTIRRYEAFDTSSDLVTPVESCRSCSELPT